MKKACLITSENIDRLKGDWQYDDSKPELTKGYYLVVDFGVTDHYELLRPEVLLVNFVKTDDKLKDDWFGVEWR